MRCSECAHWKQFYDSSKYDPEEDDFLSEEVYREFDIRRPAEWCLRLQLRWGVCLRTQMSSGESKDSTSIAVALDGSEYAAHLETREDFGCTQFAAKDSKR